MARILSGKRREKRSPLANLPLPMDSPEAESYSMLAWNVAIKGPPSLELPEIIIQYPTIAQPPDEIPPIANHAPDIPVPKSGFVLQGEVHVFGGALVGSIQKWMGPPPNDVIVGTDPPSIERVTVEGDFHMSMLIPLLRGTPYDDISFRNVAFYHQNYAFDKTKSIGWHFNADLVIDYSCGLLYQILTQVLQVDNPVLSIHNSFGYSGEQHWNAPLRLHTGSFILDGIFPNVTFSLDSGLTLTSIGVRLLGIAGFSFTPEPHSTLSFGFDIFGDMTLNVPGSVVPMDLHYDMDLIGNTVILNAEMSGKIWVDALGVEGLVLEDVEFATSFSATSPWTTFSFDVSATLSYMSSQAYLQGSYAAGGHFMLGAELYDFGPDEISDMFLEIFSETLTLPDFDVQVGSGTLSIVSGRGLSISLFDVNVVGYTAGSMEVAFTSSGASLSGALSSSTVTFGDVELRDGLMELTFWSSGRKKNVDIMLRGKLGVDFLGPTLGAVVHLYPGEGGVEWAIVADLNASSRPFDLSDAVPEVKGGFLDFSLKNAVFIAASKDDPPVSESFPGYHVQQGVQVFGVIDRIPALNGMLGEDVTGLVLRASWSKASGFNLAVSLPAESTLYVGNGMRTTPIALGIRSNPVGLAVMTHLILPANILGASASAQMEGWCQWVKPFEMDNLKIGPEVTLPIKIVYAQLPGGFGVVPGGLVIGNIRAPFAMNVGEDPKSQILSGELKKLDVSDVVTLAGNLVQQDIPKIPDGFLKFEDLKLYICPFDVVLGPTTYPAGLSFKTDFLLFEQRANIECTIDKAQKSLDIIGSIDNFELGPLSVRGSKGPCATLECHIGVSKQQLVIDGIVTLFDMKAQTYIDVQFLPKPKFKFYLLLQFASVFMFKLDAKLLGSIHDRLSDADFSLYAELENVILEYISQQIIELFDAAKVAATQGLEVAQGKVEEAQKALEDAISGAEKKVKNAEKEWQSHERSFRSSSQPIIDHYLSEISRLRAEVDKARTDFNNARRTAERAVEQANQDRSATLATGRRAVENAKHDIDRSINSAQRQLDYAKADLSKEFGVVQRAIEGAHRAVWSLQTQINDVKRTIDDYERAPGYEFWKKPAIPGLRVTVGRLDASKAFTNGVLDAARGILRGTEYLERVAAVESARGNLEDARETGKASLSAARGVLIIADDASNRAANRAKNNLEGVRAGTEFTAFKTAAEALGQFQNVNRVAYEAAVGALEGSTESAAFIAFNSAKVGLEVTKESTQLLDAAIEVLALAEKATQSTSILQELVRFGAVSVNIETIVVSGTLRGILGVDDGNARPLSATIQGYLMGNRFDIRAEFDPSKPVAFITTIFKQLWVLYTSSDVITLAASDVRHDYTENALASIYSHNLTDVGSLSFAGARSAFLQRRPNVLGLLVNESELIAAHIPHGPFSGTPLFPSVAVARRALSLMQEERGVSIFHDLEGI